MATTQNPGKNRPRLSVRLLKTHGSAAVGARDIGRSERALDSGPLSKSQLLLTLTDTCFFSIHTNLRPPLLRLSASESTLRSRPSLCACIAWPYPRHEPQHPPRQQQRACPECAASCSNQEHHSHALRRPTCVLAPFSLSKSTKRCFRVEE